MQRRSATMDACEYADSAHYAVSEPQFTFSNCRGNSHSQSLQLQGPDFSHIGNNNDKFAPDADEEDVDGDFPPPPPPDFHLNAQTGTMNAGPITTALQNANKLPLPSKVAKPVTMPTPASNFSPAARNAIAMNGMSSSMRYQVNDKQPLPQQVNSRVGKNPLFHTVFTAANGFNDIRSFSSHYAQYSDVMDALVQAELDRILRPTMRAPKAPGALPPQTPNRTVSVKSCNSPVVPAKNHSPAVAPRPPLPNGPSPLLVTQQPPQTVAVTVSNAARAQPIYAQPVLQAQVVQSASQHSSFTPSPGSPSNKLNTAQAQRSPSVMQQSPNLAAARTQQSPSPSTFLSGNSGNAGNGQSPKFVPPTPPARRSSIQNSQLLNGNITLTTIPPSAPPSAPPSVPPSVPPSAPNPQPTQPNGYATSHVLSGNGIGIGNGHSNGASANVTPQRNAVNGMNKTTLSGSASGLPQANTRGTSSQNVNVTAAFADIDQMLTGLTAELDKMLDNEVLLRRKK